MQLKIVTRKNPTTGNHLVEKAKFELTKYVESEITVCTAECTQIRCILHYTGME